MEILISVHELRSVCGMNQNLVGNGSTVTGENRKFDPWIKEAHVRLRNILGKDLFAEMQTAAASDSDFSDAANEKWKNLMEDEKGWVREFLCWKTRELSLLGVFADEDLSGVHTKSSDDFNVVSRGTLSMKMNQAKEMAESRADMLVEYLDDNAVTYSITGSTDEVPGDGEEETDFGFSFRQGAHQTPNRG